MTKAEVISTQAEELLKVKSERDGALQRATDAEEKQKKAEELKEKWFILAQQRLRNFQTAKKDRASAVKDLTEWKNKYLPVGKWFKKAYNTIIFWDKLINKRNVR